jgi:hypothetical protein
MELQKLKNRYNTLKNYRQLYMSLWQDISENMSPSSGWFDKDKGDKKRTIDYRKFIDSTPRQAISILSSGMQSGITSPSRSWFTLALSIGQRDVPNSVEIWLSSVKNLIEDILSASNVYQCLHQLYEEVATYGTGCMIIDPDFENVVNGITFTVGEYVLGKTAGNKIDTFGREFSKTVGEMVELFGKDKVSDKVRQQYENGNIDEKVNVFHMILPNIGRDAEKIDNQNMPFISVYWEDGGSKEPLRVGGYKHFPVICPRWRTKATSDIYGMGVGQEVLGDVKMLQKMNQEKLIGLSKTVRPPLQVSANVPGVVNLRPDGITRFSGTTDQAVRPVYQVPLDMNALEFAISQVEQRINKAFYVDIFSMLQTITQEKTAREVEELHSEKLMMLGPIFEMFKMEVLDILINLVFNYALDAGIVPPAPAEIEGQELNIEYVSMVAQAQKMSGVTATNQYLGVMYGLAQANPSVLDNLNFDAITRKVAKMIGVEPIMLNDEEVVAQIREQRAQEQAAMAQQQQEQLNLQNAKTASDIKLDENSALDAIMSQ